MKLKIEIDLQEKLSHAARRLAEDNSICIAEAASLRSQDSKVFDYRLEQLLLQAMHAGLSVAEEHARESKPKNGYLPARHPKYVKH